MEYTQKIEHVNNITIISEYPILTPVEKEKRDMVISRKLYALLMQINRENTSKES